MIATIISEDSIDRDFLAFTLRRSGITPTFIPTLGQTKEGWLEEPSDLIIGAFRSSPTDLKLAKQVQALRSTTATPLIILLGQVSDMEVSDLVHSGADLVLMLPISPQVLTAYAHSLLRRTGSVSQFTLPNLDLDSISLNPSTRVVQVEGSKSVHLTQLEFRLLYELMTHRGQVIPSEIIVDRVWGFTDSGSRELVRGLISRLRSKVEPNPSAPKFIHTIPGVGYMFEIEPE